MKYLKQKIVIGVVLFVPVVASAADLNLSTIRVDLGEVFAFGATIVTALATLIPLRKAIKTVNRS